MISHIIHTDSDEKHQCAPLRIGLRPESDAWRLTLAYEAAHSRNDGIGHIKRLCAALLRDNAQRVRDSEHYTTEQKAEVLKAISRRMPSVRLLHAGSSRSQKAWFTALQDAHRRGTATCAHVSNRPPVTVVVPYRCLGDGSSCDGERCVYAIFYTTAPARTAPTLAPLPPPRVPPTVAIRAVSALEAGARETAHVGLPVASPVHDLVVIDRASHRGVAEPHESTEPLLALWKEVFNGRMPFEDVKCLLFNEGYHTPRDILSVDETLDGDEYRFIVHELLQLKPPEIRRFKRARAASMAMDPSDA